MEKLSDTFFRGAEYPTAAMFVLLGVGVLVACYALWARARERNWAESALAAGVASIGIGEILVLLTGGSVARLDRIAVLAVAIMAAALLAEDIRKGGPAADGWRMLRAALRI